MKKLILTLLICLTCSASLLAGNMTIIDAYGWKDENKNYSLSITTVEDEIRLNFEDAVEDLQVQITDEAGSIYYMESVSVAAGTDYVIDVQNLPDGAYQLTLTATDGNVRNMTFIKQSS